MKKLFYTKKLTFHNLHNGEITKKLHVEFLGFAFRIPYKRITPPKDEQAEYLEII